MQWKIIPRAVFEKKWKIHNFQLHFALRILQVSATHFLKEFLNFNEIIFHFIGCNLKFQKGTKFLVVCMRLYNLLCLLVGRSVAISFLVA